MHSSGGYAGYLAAIWANDQAEYANPFLPFTGNPVAMESAMNSFRKFASYMNDEYNPIPSSIIAEGRGFWNGAGDRGDAAMIAHGAARFAMASGNRAWGEELKPLIVWCIDFCRRKKLPEGVIASDTDELENRVPAGIANLCTSTLYYDALLCAADLFESLGDDSGIAAEYRKEAAEMRRAIIDYFSGKVESFETYRYYKENTDLRSWICMPLVFGITENGDGTVAALFSERLWFGDGLLTTSSNPNSYWDRSTLYAFRGVFFCGYGKVALPYLRSYTSSRLLGDHVPYPIEAYPEQGQSHLAAESELYCRVFTEGIFGIIPRGVESFSVRPNLPEEWDFAALRRINAFGRVFDIEIHRNGDMMDIKLFDASGNELCATSVVPGEDVVFKNFEVAN